MHKWSLIVHVILLLLPFICSEEIDYVETDDHYYEMETVILDEDPYEDIHISTDASDGPSHSISTCPIDQECSESLPQTQSGPSSSQLSLQQLQFAYKFAIFGVFAVVGGVAVCYFIWKSNPFHYASSIEHSEWYVKWQATENVIEIDRLVCQEMPKSNQTLFLEVCHYKRRYLQVMDDNQALLKHCRNLIDLEQVDLDAIEERLALSLAEVHELLQQDLTTPDYQRMHERLENITKVLASEKKRVEVIKVKAIQGLRDALSRENWLELQSAVTKCDSFGILMQVRKTLAEEAKDDHFLEELSLRLKRKYDAEEALAHALLHPTDQDKLQTALHVAERDGYSHLETYKQVVKLLDELQEDFTQHKVLQELNNARSEFEDLRLSIQTNTEQRDESFLTESSMVAKLQMYGLEKQEAIKLVLSKLADRENLLLKIEAERRLAEQHAIETRRRDVEKRLHQRELARQDRAQRAELHAKRAQEEKARDAAKMQLQFELLEKKRQQRENEMQIQRELDETQRREALYKQMLDKQRLADTQYFRLMWQCSWLLVAGLWGMIFWENLHQLRVFSSHCDRPVAQKSTWSFFSSSILHLIPEVGTLSCQIMLMLRLAMLIVGALVVYVGLIHLRQERLASMLSAAALLYVFRSQWRRFVVRSPYLLLIGIYQWLVTHTFHASDKLQWMLSDKLDIRPILKCVVYPVGLVCITTIASVMVACARPMTCAMQSYEVLYQGWQHLIQD